MYFFFNHKKTKHFNNPYCLYASCRTQLFTKFVLILSSFERTAGDQQSCCIAIPGRFQNGSRQSVFYDGLSIQTVQPEVAHCSTRPTNKGEEKAATDAKCAIHCVRLFSRVIPRLRSGSLYYLLPTASLS